MRGVAEIPVKPYRLSLFLILFYLGFMVISLSGHFFFDGLALSFHAISIFTVFFIVLIAGVEFGKVLDFGKTRKIIFPKFEQLIVIMIIVQTIMIFFVWNEMIQRYGSLNYILSNASLIRAESIGTNTSPIPVWITYIASTTQFSFALSLILIEYSKKNLKYIILAIYTFILITLLDLSAFGRIGTLYSVFTIIGFFLFFKKRIFTLKRILLIVIAFLLMMSPRYIRGDNDAFTFTILAFAPYLKSDFNPFVVLLLTFYMYYFSAIPAMSVHYEMPAEPLLYGERTFTPLYNVISRFLLEDDRIILIDKFVNIPYPVNIYSIVKDLTSDFGFWGMLVVAFLFGLILGNIFRIRHKGIIWDALRVFMFGWILYIPIYNAFSFGGFFLSFMLLLLFAMFVRPILKENTEIRNQIL